MKKDKQIEALYFSSRIVIPELNLDFEIICKKEDVEQYKIFWNFIETRWRELGNKSTPISTDN